MSDDVTITVRVNNQTAQGFRDVNGNLRDMQGRFASASNDVQRSGSLMSKSMVDIRASMLSLAPAAVPVAASLAPIAVQAGAAGLAVAAFGAALKPQIGNLSDAAKAQDTYSSAVQKAGRGSKQAADAQLEVARTLAGMPAATQRASMAWQGLREQTSAWSDSMAKFTMAPVEKSFAVLGQVLPKLSPMVKGASTQLDRLVTVAGGAVNTAAFDGLSKRVNDFANQTLKGATDRAIHFMRVLSEGDASGPMASFFEYARAQGPAVKELLSNVSQAVATLAEGAAQAGPGMLTLVNALAKIAAAVPPELVGTLMSVYAAFKLIKLGGAGIAAVSGGVQTLATRIGTLSAVSTAAGGGLAGLRAAFMSLGTAAKASIVVAGIAALAVVLTKLSNIGREAPPDVDKMSTAIGRLGQSGKVSGEALRVYGKDLGGLSDAIHNLSHMGNVDKVQNFLTNLIGMDSTPVKKWKEDLDAADKGLADLVKGGNSELAAAALKKISAEYKAQGHDVSDIKPKLDDYRKALADQKFEQELAAAAMGSFGQAAQLAQAKLDAQKGAADGLRASLIALNDVNRSAYDSEIAFEVGIDNLSESFKKNGATLDIHTKAGQQNGQAMSAAAKANDEMIASGVAANESLASMTEKSSTLRTEMMKLATEGFDGNKKKATEYVNTLLGTPESITTLIKAEKAEAVAGLKEVESEIRKTPGAKQVTVSTLNAAAIKALEAVGYKTKTLKDGRTQVFTANGKALGNIAAVNRAMNAINGKRANTWVTNTITTRYSVAGSIPKGQSLHDVVGATGGLFTGSSFKHGYADGGKVTGPGTGTSDDVFAPWLSNGEFVMKKAAVDRYGERFMHLLNEGRLAMPRFAKGGKVSARTKAEQEARKDARGDLTISHFGQAAGYQRSEFGSALAKPDSVSSLVNALNQWRGIILKATHGGTESKLLKQLDATGRALLKQEKQLNQVTASLGKAKDKLNDLKSSASSLSSSVKGGVLSSANITKGATSGTPMTVASIMGNATQSRDKAKAFAEALKTLKAKGVDKGLIEDIANAGIEGGGLETAGALMGASASEISSLNTLRSQTVTYAKSAGGTAADAVYGDAIKAQTAVVKMLTKSQDSLKKSMDKLAKSMEKAIEAAFGKKAAGGIVGMAASGGIRSGLTWVGEHGPELADLPVGSRVWSNPDSRRKAAAPWTSMLNTPHRAPAPGAAVGGVQREVKVVLEIQGTTNSRYEEFLLTELRRMVRARGGNVQQVLNPPRGR
ncbi:phage tail protein [Streptomyces sp. NPDC056738]|uniref:phage tail protein n=1 Tax=Streptomyces sp. NPDC056738 TaxID=3345933 RepID=UPI00368692B0